MTSQTRFDLEMQYENVKKHNHDKDYYVSILVCQFDSEAYSFSVKKSFSNVLANYFTFQTTLSHGKAKDLIKTYLID